MLKKWYPAQQPGVNLAEQVGPVDYCVDIYDHRKRDRVFHINMLKKCEEMVPSPATRRSQPSGASR